MRQVFKTLRSDSAKEVNVPLRFTLLLGGSKTGHIACLLQVLAPISAATSPSSISVLSPKISGRPT